MCITNQGKRINIAVGKKHSAPNRNAGKNISCRGFKKVTEDEEMSTSKIQNTINKRYDKEIFEKQFFIHIALLT